MALLCLLMYPLCFLRCYSEPNAPPSHVQGHNSSSTSILVQWADVNATDQNGIILSYTVGYTALPGGSEETKVVNAPATDTTLTGLNEFTNYSITVFASTVKGDGNASAPITVITDEDSKCAFLCNKLNYIIFYSYIKKLKLRSLIYSINLLCSPLCYSVRAQCPSI